MSNYSNIDLEGLTEQEREGILELQNETHVSGDAEGLPEDTPQGQREPEIEGDAKVAAGADALPVQEEGQGEPKPEPEQEPEGDTVGTIAAQNTPPVAPLAPAFPTYDAPQDAQNRLAEIDGLLQKIGSDFEEGNLTHRQYHHEMLQLTNEKQELREQLFKAHLSQDIQQNTWFNITVPAFLAAHPQYNDNEVLFESLNAQVLKLQADNPNQALDPSVLITAHERLAAAFNWGGAKALAQPVSAAKPQVPVSAPAPAQPLRDMPPNLARIPAADMTEAADGGRFAHLDALAQSNNASEYEKEISRLSEADRAAYLQMR